MLRTLLITLIVSCTYQLTAQELTELEKRNGFKDLKLGMVIDSVKGMKFKKEFEDHYQKHKFLARLYSVENPAYEKIGEVSVNKIELKTYNDQIYQIHVVTEKDPRLMKALESIYGKSEYDLKGETYFWKTPTVLLKFKPHSKKELEMVYTSYPVLNQTKEDKEKKVEEIADDF